MAKNRIEELVSKAEELEANKAERMAAAEKAAEYVKEMQKAEKAAAVSGNIEAYSKAKAEREAAETKAYVLREYANSATSLSPEEINSAWKDYAADYNKDFEKALKDYEKGRAALFEKYKALVKMQSKALYNREICGKMIGLSPADFGIYANYKGQLKGLLTLPTNGEDIDYYAKSGDLKNIPNIREAYGQIVKMQRAGVIPD